jgi:vitamin B12 transporter
VQDQWTWQNEVDTPVGVVLAGVENLTQRVSGSTAYTVSSRSTDSAFVGLNGSHGPHNWQLNARHDDNSQFGSANTTLAGYAYKFSPDWKVFGSTGTSFKAPTFNALYFPGFGNATTLPESGRNSEVGVGWGGENYHGSLTYFQNRIQGFITTLPVVANIPVVRIEGYSLAVGGERGAFDYHAQLDLLDARNELTGLKLIRRPDQQLTVSANYAIGQWKLCTSLLIASDSYENAANTQSLGGYGTVDAYAAYDLQHGWGIEAKLVNAGDKAYQTASGYNQPGRSAYLTLRYAPK